MKRTSSKKVLGYKVFIKKRGWKSYMGIYVFGAYEKIAKIRKKAKLQFFSENKWITGFSKLAYYTKVMPILPVITEVRPIKDE